ncbi:hypothetical protein CRENBAI_009591 [Crenichthys baileyi]|uniref:Uncharacterized protein n=1 Tax=Crenichthys baileyi TaxID=28760 RepID=A0AAV9S1I9_9TELE
MSRHFDNICNCFNTCPNFNQNRIHLSVISVSLFVVQYPTLLYVPSRDKTILSWHCPCRVTSVCECVSTHLSKLVAVLGRPEEVNTTARSPVWFTGMGVGVAEEGYFSYASLDLVMAFRKVIHQDYMITSQNLEAFGVYVIQ